MKRGKAPKDGSAATDGTDKLQALSDQELASANPEIEYSPIGGGDHAKNQPHWRIYFELVSDPGVRFGLDIAGEVVLGRGHDAPNVVDLTPYGALDYGVSRRHVLLRPTPTKLHVIDLGSTNGTLRNGRSIGVNTPYNLVDGDTLALGKLRLITRITERPKGQTTALRKQADFGSALIEIAATITSQLEIDEVLNQITETSMALTSAGEVGIWLVDEESGEVFLEAERGIEEDKVKRIRVRPDSDSPVAQVIKTGHALRASRQKGGDPIKVNTDYFVESIVYVPLTLGGVTFGVLSAAHRKPGNQFDERDEHFLGVIAHFAAIALQNARLFHLTDEALEKRVGELAALNELSQAVSISLDLREVDKVLMEQIRKYWQVDVAALWLAPNHETEEFVPTPFSKLLPDTDATSHAIGRLVAESAESGEPVVANDVQYAPRADNSKNATLMVAGSAVCVPLKVQQQVVGVVTLFKKGRARFAEEDVERLTAFANPVATAIHNARLYAESERERATVRATAKTFAEPLVIVGEDNETLITNDAADRLLDMDMSAVFEGIRNTVGRTDYLTLGDRTYLASVHQEGSVGTIAIMQDVTDHIRAEEALRESEERYRTLVETSPEAIIVTDLDRKIMLCNPQAAVLCGLKSPKEAIGKDLFSFIAPEDHTRAGENLTDALKTGPIKNVEYILLKEDGTRCPVEMSLSVVKDQSQAPTGFIQVARDISHIKKLEQARADFVHALSHDLKSPLSSIKGWTQLMEHGQVLDAQSSLFVKKIAKASDGVINMIEQLLDIASLSEVPKLHVAPCDLDEIVNKAVSDLEGTAQAKAIPIEVKVIGTPHPITGDRSRLYRSVLNLLDNAVKYSPPKSKVTVTLAFEQKEILLTVRDGGPGIPEADIPHIFERYFRGEDAAQSNPGSGLGLANVYAAIHAHKGSINVKNVKGGGAEFTIILPAEASKQVITAPV